MASTDKKPLSFLNDSAWWRQAIPYLYNYLMAVAVVAAVTLLLFILRPYLSTSTVALIYVLAVLVITTWLGFGPGLLSGFLAFLCFNYYFLLPYYTLIVHHPQDILALAVFLVVAVLTSQLVGQAKNSLAAARAREHELTRLYELGISLTGVNNPQEIAQIVATHTLETFQAEQVVLRLPNFQNEATIVAQAPPNQFPVKRKPEAVSALQTARGFLGEIQLWRENMPLEPPEEKTLRAFAAQAALALERAGLTQAETRARVLEESDRLKSALLSSVSHELRTPLAAIKASVTSLIDGEVNPQSPEGQDLLAAIDEEADHLNRLVGNLLDMTRLESGALKPDRQWNVLSEIVGSVLHRLRRPLTHFKVEVDIPDDLPLVPVDFQQIERVFANLLGNSAKYAPPNSTIQVQASLRDERTLLVKITNQGPPVAEADLERIFDKFYRVTNARQVTGTGLGLSICKGIIQAHGGEIWARNLPGRFAFYFTLPLEWDGRPAPTVAADE
jgi:two-component system sensor histidine kinase KdpD